MKSVSPRGLPGFSHENDIDWSFLCETDDKERMCRSLDFETMPSCTSLASLYADRSEPSLSKRTKVDDQGLFGSERVKAALDSSKTKESLKDRILSMWTNTKNGFMAKLTPEFKDSEIWMLGKHYENDLSTFKKDFYHLPWITYRRGFPELGTQGMTSDVGWGCMIRCAQMCLAVTLNAHLKSIKAPHKDLDMRILKMFGDKPHPDCPFSIHSIVFSGEKKGRLAGSWFGPASISVAIREVLKERQIGMDLLDDLAIYIAQDSTVYIRDALDEMRKGHKSLMLIIPMRLGFHHINEVYIEAFKRVFQWKFCMGVMGGRPKHSLFFVGYQDNDLIYLDPHFIQESVDLANVQSKESYHCNNPMKLNIGKMDPTCAAAFYCSDESELWDLISLVRQTEDDLKGLKVIPGIPKQIPLLNFVDGRHLDFLDQDTSSCGVEVISDESMSSEFGKVSIQGQKTGGELQNEMSSMKMCPIASDDKPKLTKVIINKDGSSSFRANMNLGGSISSRCSYGGFARSYLEYFIGVNDNKETIATSNGSEMPSIGNNDSYSMLDGINPKRDGYSSTESSDFSFLSSSSGNCKPPRACTSSGTRRLSGFEEGKGMREEDGFVML